MNLCAVLYCSLLRECVTTLLGMVAGGNSGNREAASSVFDSHCIQQSPPVILATHSHHMVIELGKIGDHIPPFLL